MRASGEAELPCRSRERKYRIRMLRFNTMSILESVPHFYRNHTPVGDVIWKPASTRTIDQPRKLRGPLVRRKSPNALPPWQLHCQHGGRPVRAIPSIHYPSAPCRSYLYTRRYVSTSAEANSGMLCIESTNSHHGQLSKADMEIVVYYRVFLSRAATPSPVLPGSISS